MQINKQKLKKIFKKGFIVVTLSTTLVVTNSITVQAQNVSYTNEDTNYIFSVNVDNNKAIIRVGDLALSSGLFDYQIKNKIKKGVDNVIETKTPIKDICLFQKDGKINVAMLNIFEQIELLDMEKLYKNGEFKSTDVIAGFSKVQTITIDEKGQAIAKMKSKQEIIPSVYDKSFNIDLSKSFKELSINKNYTYPFDIKINEFGKAQIKIKKNFLNDKYLSENAKKTIIPNKLYTIKTDKKVKDIVINSCSKNSIPEMIFIMEDDSIEALKFPENNNFETIKLERYGKNVTLKEVTSNIKRYNFLRLEDGSLTPLPQVYPKNFSSYRRDMSQLSIPLKEKIAQKASVRITANGNVGIILDKNAVEYSQLSYVALSKVNFYSETFIKLDSKAVDITYVSNKAQYLSDIFILKENSEVEMIDMPYFYETGEFVTRKIDNDLYKAIKIGTDNKDYYNTYLQRQNGTTRSFPTSYTSGLQYTYK